MDDEYFKVLVIAVTAILVVSLVINALLASDPASLSAPPIRMQGYITESGSPVMGYYLAPDQITGYPSGTEICQNCK